MKEVRFLYDHLERRERAFFISTSGEGLGLSDESPLSLYPPQARGSVRARRARFRYDRLKRSKKLEKPSPYLHVEKMAASRAPYAMLSLFPWQTESALTLGALFVNVGLSVAPFVFHHREGRLNLPYDFQINLVFFLPFVNIS